MSYDVSIGNESFNYTYNMSRLFYDHMEGGIPYLHGKTGAQAAESVSNGFNRLHSTYTGAKQFREEYDAPNGWGSTDGALIFLGLILAACHRNPDEVVTVS